MKKIAIFTICFGLLITINPVHSEARTIVRHLTMNEIGTAIRLDATQPYGSCAVNKKETKKELRKLCKAKNHNNRAAGKCTRKAYKTVINTYDNC